VALPTLSLQSYEEPNHPKVDAVTLMGENGIVGSIVLMGDKAAMIWVGWGQLDLSSTTTTTSSGTSTTRFGKGESWMLLYCSCFREIVFQYPSFLFPSCFHSQGTPTMGQLVVAMPRTNYRGAFGGEHHKNEAPCSQMIGSPSSDDQILANQMAARLSLRSGRAVFVSCQLSSTGDGGTGVAARDDSWTSGLDSDMISHRAAALAEKEIWRILQEDRKQ
jgi:hypothetical protein